MNMNFPKYFADADSNFKEADFVIFGIPYDKTSSFRSGAKWGPKKIREASWNFETFNVFTGVDLKEIRFHDYGDIDVENDSPNLMVKKVKDFTSTLLSNQKIPIALGGEHSITTGVIQALPKDIAVLSLDAHLDYRNEYENEKYNHACVIRRIADHIGVENIAVVGLRSAEKEEFIEAKNNKLMFFNTVDIKEKTLDKVISEIKKHFKNKKMYLTLDIDVVDPAYAPGTSTPEPFGLTPLEVIEIIKNFSSQLIGFDITEVCSPYDHGETALLAAKIIRLVIEEIWVQRLEVA